MVSRQVEGDLGWVGEEALASRKQGACQICSSPAFPEHSMLYLPLLPWGGLQGPSPDPSWDVYTHSTSVTPFFPSSARPQSHHQNNLYELSAKLERGPTEGRVLWGVEFVRGE